ncbi:MAG: substrate-binding domain-containing protein [Candidatus Lokiarchaeota archaeon]|nr:substrate-binding domain-containing protein [Candidatus Lokiarchaeota archaeon]
MRIKKKKNSSRKIRKKSIGSLFLLFIIGFVSGDLITNAVLLGGEGGVHITIIYSSEKASWMTVAYNNFLEEWSREHPEEKITIEMHPYGSSDSIISILNDEIHPTIWSPASSIWMPFLNTKWKDYTEGDDLVKIDEAIKIIYSPIVIATWETFNQTHAIRSLADIRRLNLDPSVIMRMAHTDPRLSNSGFMTTIMALAAASEKASENLTMEDLLNPDVEKWIKEFESSAVLYGKSTGFLSRYMKDGGPDSLNIAFLYENLVSDISNSATGGKIIAIYPEEGTLYSDHPFCVLNANWISPEQRNVAEAFLDFLNKRDTVISAMRYGFRPIDSTIPLDPSIFNYESHGIRYNISVPELNTPNSGNVLLKIPDLWYLCKATA